VIINLIVTIIINNIILATIIIVIVVLGTKGVSIQMNQCKVSLDLKGSDILCSLMCSGNSRSMILRLGS